MSVCACVEEGCVGMHYCARVCVGVWGVYACVGGCEDMETPAPDVI